MAAISWQGSGSSSTDTRTTSTAPASRCARGGMGRSRGSGSTSNSPRDAVDRPERWVWVYHSPPSDSPLCVAGPDKQFPDPDLAEWIDRYEPDLVICGHIHQAPWASGGGWIDRRGATWLVNAGHQPGPMPAHVVIDLDASNRGVGRAAGPGELVGVEFSSRGSGRRAEPDTTVRV